MPQRAEGCLGSWCPGEPRQPILRDTGTDVSRVVPHPWDLPHQLVQFIMVWSCLGSGQPHLEQNRAALPGRGCATSCTCRMATSGTRAHTAVWLSPGLNSVQRTLWHLTPLYSLFRPVNPSSQSHNALPN